MNLEALSRKLFSAVDTGVSALRAIARGRPGDYLVVEDTCYIGEKREALREFARAHPGQFLDTRFSDLFGYNGTFNFNGYLRKR